jgi:hypothetical protein
MFFLELQTAAISVGVLFRCLNRLLVLITQVVDSVGLRWYIFRDSSAINEINRKAS